MILKKIIISIFCLFSFYSIAFSQASATAGSTFKDFGVYSPHPLVNGYTFNAFNTAENTKGRRYFFDQWVKGSVINSSNKEISGNDYFFNFDKISNALLVTRDKKEIIEVNKESIKSMNLEENGVSFYFEKQDQINPDRFVQILVKADSLKYSLYKNFNTKLKKSDYHTDGITESGKPYDEYVDEPAYFIFHRGEMKPVTLKIKSIKNAVKDDTKKLNNFYGDHNSEEINENYLKKLVLYLNE
jgi:hypothetical protein